MSSTYRSWDEREADAEKTRAEAAKLQAEAAAATQTLDAVAARTETEKLAEQVKQARLLKTLTAVEDEAADDRRHRQEKRREEQLDRGVAFKQLVTTIFILGLLASLPSLIDYFLDLRAEGKPDTGPAWYLLPVPFFLELLALTSVRGTQWAVRKGFARWPFWILTGVLAGFAGYINGTKGAELFGPIAGTALAATSIAGPVLIEIRELIEARTAGDNRSAAQRAADKAKARAEAAKAAKQRKKRQQQDREREALFPNEFKEYRKILASVPADSLSRDDAWSEAQVAVRFPKVYDRFQDLLALPGAPARPVVLDAAWRDVEGGPLGTTAASLARRLQAEKNLADVLQAAEYTPERVAVEHLLADLFPDRLGGEEGPAGAVPGKGPQGPSKTPGALGGIEKQPVGRAPRKDATEPLREADIEAAKKLRDAVPPAQFSTPAVAKLLGRSKVYARRVRDAVQSEQN
ncbi:hypothetical protein [Streptomyces lavendofoliae]|uniref:DUF2637 domain-containing protein n=1 Tax=Streptomyces lavendofoliae TaxID=67314 RepID=A0A918M6N3_9ACTN|nr:hypothetical protein [Streptomyces lavendofoliae]GGU52442.1 hypothetical protein GCM10010274_46710 [Streptomyces lavendofoliae]